MEEFTNVELRLVKDVNPGDIESLLSLFSAVERFKPAEIRVGAEEGTTIQVVVGELGEINLKLGNDIEKGQRKTIMTLFWYAERSRTWEIRKKAKAGDSVIIKMLISHTAEKPQFN